MSDHQANNKDQYIIQNQSKGATKGQSNDQINQSKDSENELQSANSANGMAYSQAKKLCEDQMLELQQKIQELSSQEQKEYIEQAQIQCNEYLSKFLNPDDQSNEVSQEEDSLTLAEQQQNFMAQQQCQALGLEGLQSQFNATGSLDNQHNQGMQTDESNEFSILKQQAMQQQQANMFLQQMGQNFNQKEIFSHLQTQYKQAMRQQMGNQLRNFARQMFNKINQRQKKKLHKEAKQYLDLYIQDQKKLQIQLNSASTNPSIRGSGNAYFESTTDFEYQANPQRYLNEVEGTLRKHKDLASNFQRFIQKVFDDPEQEQVYTDFMINYQEVYSIYHNLAINYTFAQHQEDEEKQEMLGTQIFNLIMPLAQKIDPKLLNLIPKETLEKFRIEYDNDNINIISWEQIESYTNSSNSEDHSNNDSDSDGSDQSDSNDNEPNISTNSQMIGDTSDQETLNEGSNDQAPNEKGKYIDKGGLGYQYNNIPPSALTGKNKSLVMQINYSYPTLKNIKSNDIRPLDNLFKSLKDEKDWIAFCKLLYLYFEGVFSLSEFSKMYEEKFNNKLKQEIKDEIEKLIPTRDQNRRALSNLLKPWNDTENQTFEKIPDSSYYKIEEGFPIPTCTKKMMEEVYWKNINDQYLSLATGSENFKFKFRNTNEELIYKTEDKMYELDTQIDNIQKSYEIVVEQCLQFEHLSETEQAIYKFPFNLLNPLRFYWDQKFRKGIHEQYFKEGKVLKAKEIASLKQQFNGKLEFLKNQKASNIIEYKENFRKNFTKSLDHKSFQYKDFMKKYLQKQNHVKSIKQIQEDNYLKKRLTQNKLNLLYGSGDQSVKSNYKFFNTYGKDFSGKFDPERLRMLDSTPDYPIDMKFMDSLSIDFIHKLQFKCPHSRFLMNNTQAIEITLKLVIQYIKLTNLASNAITGDKQQLMQALKFMMVHFLKVDNFDQIEQQSEIIQPLTQDMIDVLMNSADYYQKKYTGEIDHMQEVFPIEDPSINQSPLKNILNQNSENKQQQIELTENQLPPSSERESEANISKIDQSNQESSQYKVLKINRAQRNDKQQLQQDMFIPRYVRDNNRPEKERYQLFYGPLNIYMFLVYFYSVYERVIKAQELVSKKVIQDFKDDFSQQKWSLKFQSRTQTLIDERFSYLIKAILTVMTQNNILDSYKYEDIARELLGNEAYLLFQIDKLINYCQKQLTLFQTDNNCKAAKTLFEEFQTGKMEDETEYLSTFYKVSNEQAIITKELIQNQKTNPQTGGDKSAASAMNKDNTNPNMNLQAFRFMYSPKSCIMTIHFMVLHPFFMQEQKKISNAPQPIQSRIPIHPINGDINEQETIQGLLSTTTNPMQLEENPLPQGEVDTSPQIYLNRNLKRMKALRGQNHLYHKMSTQNCLELSMVPLTHQIAFEPNTEDIVEVRRTSEKTKTILIKRKFAQMTMDREYHNQAHNVMMKRLKTINEETGHHEINQMLDMSQSYQDCFLVKTNKDSSQNNPEVEAAEEIASKVPASVTTRKTRSVANSNQKQQSGSRRNQDTENSQNTKI